MDIDKRKISASALEKLRQTIISQFAEGQFHTTGIRAICQQAGVSPQTIYKYYGTKEKLLLACIEQDLAQLTANAKQKMAEANNTQQKLLALNDAQFEFYAQHPAIARLAFMNVPAAFWIQQNSSAQKEFQELLVEQFALAQQEQLLNKELNLTLIQDITSGAVARVIIRWLLNDCQEDLTQIGREFFNVMWMTTQ